MKKLNPAAVYAAIIRGCPAMKPTYGKQPYGVEARQRYEAGRYGQERDVVTVEVSERYPSAGEGERRKANEVKGTLLGLAESVPEAAHDLKNAAEKCHAALNKAAEEKLAQAKAEASERCRAKMAKVRMALESVGLEVLEERPYPNGIGIELQVARKVEVAV